MVPKVYILEVYWDKAIDKLFSLATNVLLNALFRHMRRIKDLNYFVFWLPFFLAFNNKE